MLPLIRLRILGRIFRLSGFCGATVRADYEDYKVGERQRLVILSEAKKLGKIQRNFFYAKGLHARLFDDAQDFSLRSA